MGAMAPVEKKRQPFPIPWGLLVALGIYALAVLGFVWWRYWSSPQYQAAEQYDAAIRILGVDDGRKAPPDKLVEAYEHLLEAGRLMPEIRELHEHAEALNSRFVERHIR